jgi:hypothetical protein
MSDHDWYRRKLPVVAAGIATAEEEERVRAHREACGECQERWQRYQATEADDVHLSSSMMARWPRASAKLIGLEREMVQRHLDRCEECREDLRLAGFEPAAAPSASITSARPRAWWRGLATGAGVTALAASLAWLLLMPSTEPDPGGPVPWVVPSQLRGSPTSLAPGTRQIAITLATPRELDIRRPAELEVFGPDGRSLLRSDLEPEQLTRSTIIVVVRSARPLASGAYRVRLLQSTDDGPPVEIENRFELAIEE